MFDAFESARADDDWRELLSHEEVYRPLPNVRCHPKWILFRDASGELKRLCSDGPFLDGPSHWKASAALSDAILLETIKGGLCNELGKIHLLPGQELASDTVYGRAHVGWQWGEWPTDPAQRGDYVLCRSAFDAFVESHFNGKVNYRGIVVVDADAAPAVRFLAIQERLHRENPTRRYQQSWGPRLHGVYSAEHPDAPIPQSAGPVMAAMIKSRPKPRPKP